MFQSKGLYLDNKALHRDLLRRLNELKKPQAYLCERLKIARSTFWRISQNKDITLTTFFKLMEWLDEDLNTYVKKPSLKTRTHGNKINQ